MKNRLAVAGLCFTLTAGMLTGCSGNSGKAIITLDGQKTEYAVANIMLRYSQAQMQAFYGSYLGDNLWSQYGDSTKSTMMDTLKQMLILEQHQDEYNVSLTDDDKKKIDEAAQQFMDDNDQATLKSMGATKERVARVLELYTIRNKMSNAIVADVDTASKKERIINERKSSKFSEVYDAWESAADYTQDDALLKEITFNDIYQMATEAQSETGTESTESTEDAGSTEATEAASETESAAATE